MLITKIQIVKLVYEGHSREPENIPFMSNYPSYAG